MSEFEELFEKVGSSRFPEIGEGVRVRPLLKTDDLRLIRRVFVGYIRTGGAGGDEVRCRALFKRMLRRVRG